MLAKYNDQECTVDSSVLIELSEFGRLDEEPEIMDDLLNIFYATTPKRLENLAAAAQRHDSKSMFLLAHSLKSSCGYLGAKRMQGMCLMLEEMCRLGKTTGGELLVQSIAVEYGLVKVALEKTASNIRLGFQKQGHK